MRKTAFDWDSATPWVGSAVGGLGLGALGYLLAPKKYKKLFGALGLLGGAAGGYFGGTALQNHVNNKRLETALQTPSGRAMYADWLRNNSNLTDAQVADIMNGGDPSMLAWRPSMGGSTGSQALLAGLNNLDNEGSSKYMDYAPGFLGFTAANKVADKLDLINKIDPGNKMHWLARLGLDAGGRIALGTAIQAPLNMAGSMAASLIPGMRGGVTNSTLKWLARNGIISTGEAAKMMLNGSTMSRAGVAVRGVNSALGAATLAHNTIKNVHDAWTGKTYEDDAAAMQEMGPNMSTGQAFLAALTRNTVRTGGQTAGAILTLKGSPVAGSLLGASLPIDHPLSAMKQGVTSIGNLFSDRGRREESAYWRLLKSHGGEGRGGWEGFLRAMSSGYFEADQDREFARMQQGINRAGDQRLQLARGVTARILNDPANSDLAARYQTNKWTSADTTRLNRLRRAYGYDLNKPLF